MAQYARCLLCEALYENRFQAAECPCRGCDHATIEDLLTCAKCAEDVADLLCCDGTQHQSIDEIFDCPECVASLNYCTI